MKSFYNVFHSNGTGLREPIILKQPKILLGVGHKNVLFFTWDWWLKFWGRLKNYNQLSPEKNSHGRIYRNLNGNYFLTREKKERERKIFKKLTSLPDHRTEVLQVFSFGDLGKRWEQQKERQLSVCPLSTSHKNIYPLLWNSGSLLLSFLTSFPKENTL